MMSELVVKRSMAVILSLIFIMSIVPTFAEAQVVDSVDIRIPGRDQGGMKIVAGVLHNLSVELNSPVNSVDIYAHSVENLDYQIINVTESLVGVIDDTTYSGNLKFKDIVGEAVLESNGNLIPATEYTITNETGQISILPSTYIALNLDQGLNISYSTLRNMTNYYHWSYNNSVWTDNLGLDLINTGLSEIYGNTYCFYIGMIGNATPGHWSLSIITDGQTDQAWDGTLQVEAPVSGIAFSGPNFYFNVPPFETDSINTYVPDNPRNTTYFTTTNSGNVPMDFQITYDDFNDRFSTTNSTGVTYPFEKRTHHISFQADAWSPREFKVKGRIHGEPKMLVNPSMISFILAPESAFNVIVTVARPGFEIFQMPGLVVQYNERILANYNDELALDLYITGTKNSHLSTEGDKLTLLNIQQDGIIMSQPVYIQVSEETETHLIVNVNCSIAPPRGKLSMMAYVNFVAETDDFVSSGNFTTTIVVKAKSFLEEEEDTGLGSMNILAIILIIAGIALAFLSMAYYKRKEEKERKIKEEKEKAEKKNKKGGSGYKRRKKKKWV